jgi:hypothetical protein
MLVAGLDLARRRDHSALVLLDTEPDRLTVTAALRLPQAALRQQFTLIAPHLAGLDLLVFDQSGLGDAAAELLPKTPPHVGVCLIAGGRPLARSAQGDRLVVGKSWLIQRLGTAMRSMRPGAISCGASLNASCSSRAGEAGTAWRRLAATTIWSSRRRSPSLQLIYGRRQCRDLALDRTEDASSEFLRKVTSVLCAVWCILDNRI